MSCPTARRAFICGASAVGLHHYRARQHEDYKLPVMCEPPTYSSPSALRKNPTLHLPRAAFIRKNANSVASEYDIRGSVAGDGAYSTVVIGTNKYSGIKRAIKKIPKKDTNEQEFEVEIRSLMALDHPHIVKMLQYFDEGDDFYIAFELIDGPDLVQHIVRRAGELEGYVPEEELSIILRQVLKAILSCHEGGIVHRDVKLENFMIQGQEMVVKMIDLGLAMRKEDPHEVIGTFRYMAPEIYFSTERYTKAVDMWALGVSVYTMLTLAPLLPDEKDDVRDLLSDKKYVANKLKSCDVLKDRKLSKEARDFLNKLLAYDPRYRITAQEALQHPFIQRSGTRGLTEAIMKSRLAAKMEAFAMAPPLKRIGLLAIASTVSQCHDKELIDVRLLFRTLNKSGNGKLRLCEIEDALKQEGFSLPAHFHEILKICSSCGNASLNFNEFIACNLPDCFLNEQLCATVFRLLDRDSNGRLGSEDMKMLFASGGKPAPEFCEDIVRRSTGQSSVTSSEFCKFMLD